MTSPNLDRPALGQAEDGLLSTLPADLARHRVLNTKQTAAFIGFSVPHTRRLYREGKMPEPLKLSSRKLCWRVGDLIDWLASCQRRTDL